MNVLCDKCFQSHGITLPMDSAGSLVIHSPDIEGPIGECYQCVGCGRLYSGAAGYFYFRHEDMSHRRLSPVCDDDAAFMYLQSGETSKQHGTFACLRCGRTKDKTLEVVVA